MCGCRYSSHTCTIWVINCHRCFNKYQSINGETAAYDQALHRPLTTDRLKTNNDNYNNVSFSFFFIFFFYQDIVTHQYAYIAVLIVEISSLIVNNFHSIFIHFTAWCQNVIYVSKRRSRVSRWIMLWISCESSCRRSWWIVRLLATSLDTFSK